MPNKKERMGDLDPAICLQYLVITPRGQEREMKTYRECWDRIWSI